MALLRISTKFLMDNISTKAIKILDEQKRFPSSLGKIQYGGKFNVKPWIRKGFLEIIMRPEPLNEEEASALELKEALRYVAAREKYIRSTTSP